MIQLHYYPSTASMVPHLLLQEMEVPFELVLVDRVANAHKTPTYLHLNPNGLIPVLTEGELVLYETAAICLHLCDTHTWANMAPAFGSVARAHFYKWLMWLTNTLQSALVAYFYPQRWVHPDNAEGAQQVQLQAQEKIMGMLHQLDIELQRHAGPWFMGDTFSALDPYVFTLCRWTRHFSHSPARELPELGPYLQRVLARPATQRVLVAENVQAPFI
jgi:glutathione S-transferase